MALTFRKYHVEGMGKIIKDSKKIHVWSFDRNDKQYTLVLTDSVLSSKFRVQVQTELVYYGKLCESIKREGYKFEFGGMHMKLQKVNDSKYDLFIDSHRFVRDRSVEDDTDNLLRANEPIDDDTLQFAGFVKDFKKSMLSDFEHNKGSSFIHYSLQPKVAKSLHNANQRVIQAMLAEIPTENDMSKSNSCTEHEKKIRRSFNGEHCRIALTPDKKHEKCADTLSPTQVNENCDTCTDGEISEGKVNYQHQPNPRVSRDGVITLGTLALRFKSCEDVQNSDHKQLTDNTQNEKPSQGDKPAKLDDARDEYMNDMSGKKKAGKAFRENIDNGQSILGNEQTDYEESICSCIDSKIYRNRKTSLKLLPFSKDLVLEQLEENRSHLLDVTQSFIHID